MGFCFVCDEPLEKFRVIAANLIQKIRVCRRDMRWPGNPSPFPFIGGGQLRSAFNSGPVGQQLRVRLDLADSFRQDSERCLARFQRVCVRYNMLAVLDAQFVQKK